MTTESTGIFHLSKSGLREKLLAYFFTNPESSLYLRQIALILNLDPANLSRELNKLEKEGVFISKRQGPLKYFSLNDRYALFDELRSIVFKTIGVKGALASTLREIPGIKQAFIYGSFAKNMERPGSDIDLCLVIEKDEFKEPFLLSSIHELEKQLGREISYVYFTESEWKKKEKAADSFVLGLRDGKKIELTNEKY